MQKYCQFKLLCIHRIFIDKMSLLFTNFKYATWIQGQFMGYNIRGGFQSGCRKFIAIYVIYLWKKNICRFFLWARTAHVDINVLWIKESKQLKKNNLWAQPYAIFVWLLRNYCLIIVWLLFKIFLFEKKKNWFCSYIDDIIEQPDRW